MVNAPTRAPVAATKASSQSGARATLLQRKCACDEKPGLTGACQECQKKRAQGLRPTGTNTLTTVPPSVYHVLRSDGQPLDAGTRSFMEARLGHDFSHVRVHADAVAADSASQVGALAYTVGRHIVFDHSSYAPATSTGQELLAHELVHVVQQANVRPSSTISVSQTSDPTEIEAQRVATSIRNPRVSTFVLGGGLERASRLSTPHVQRKPKPTVFQGLACAPTNRLQPNLEHRLIQADYLTNLNPSAGGKEFAIPAATPKGFVGYADLVDLAKFELYEIKSSRHPGEIQRGVSEVNLYEFAAKRHCDKRWRTGKSYPLFRTIHLSTTGASSKVLVAGRMFPGLIVYAWVSPDKERELASEYASKSAAPAQAKEPKPEKQLHLTNVHPLLRGVIPRPGVKVPDGSLFIVLLSERWLDLMEGMADVSRRKAMLSPSIRPDVKLYRDISATIYGAMAIGYVVAIAGAIVAAKAAGAAAAAAPAVAAAPPAAAPAAAAGRVAAGAVRAAPQLRVLPGGAAKAAVRKLGEETGKMAAGWSVFFLLAGAGLIDPRTASAAEVTDAIETPEGRRAVLPLRNVLQKNLKAAVAVLDATEAPDLVQRMGEVFVLDAKTYRAIALAVTE